MVQMIQTPVVIVGAGPVGLGLGLELGHNGQAATILELGDGVIDQPKIGVMAVRTMEFFRRWGIVNRIRHAGFPDDYELSQVFCTSLGGWLLDKEFYPSTRDLPVPPWSPERKQRCPQIWLNPILQQAVEEHPKIDLRLRHKVKSFVAHDSHVDVIAENLSTGEDVLFRTDYLVGCDGAGSDIRRRVGITLQGKQKLSHSTSILLRCHSLLDRIDKGQAERYIFVGPEGTWGNWTVIDGKDLWRLTILGGSEKTEIDSEQAHDWVRRALGAPIAYDLLSVTTWRRTELIADAYQAGRVLLAGDAVHTMSPTGGMGMNTGMGDAVDLGWKLSGTLQGWGGPELLKSYESERRPIAIRNGAFSTYNFSAWATPEDCAAILDDSPDGAALRARVGKALRDSTRTDWEPWGLQMGYRYESSPIIVADGTPPTPDDYRTYIQTARPGSRAPHAWIRQGVSTIDLVGQGFTLFSFGAGQETASAEQQALAQIRNIPLKHVAIDSPAIAALYGAALVLIRPDGHVAWRSDSAAGLEDALSTAAGWMSHT